MFGKASFQETAYLVTFGQNGKFHFLSSVNTRLIFEESVIHSVLSKFFPALTRSIITIPQHS